MNNFFDLKSIKFRITFFIVGSVFLIFNLFIFVTAEEYKQTLVDSAQKRMYNEAERYVFEVKSIAENYLNETQSFANILSSVKSPQSPVDLSREQVISLMTNLLYDKSNYNSIGAIWNPNAFDMRDQDFVNQLYHDGTGNFTPMIRRGANSSIIVEPDSKAYLRPYYLEPKQSKKNYIGSPKAVNEKGQKKLEVPFASIINYRGIFYGVVRFNIDIATIITKTQELEILDGKADVELISADGNIIAASSSIETINIALKDLMESPTEISRLLNTESYSITKNDDVITTIHPIILKGTSNKWFVRLRVSEKDILSEASKFRTIWLIVNVVLFLLALLSVGAFVNYSLAPLHQLSEYVHNLSIGKVKQNTQLRATGSEIKNLYELLKNLADGINYNAEFASEIGKGNLAVPFSPLSDEDKLGNALLEMQKSLQETKSEENERKENERIRTWTNDGIAELNKVVRLVPERVADLSSAVLSFLVNYLKMNQGGFFIHHEGEKSSYFELSAAYAFNKERLIEERVPAEDGLIHSCIKEQKTIYLKEIPKNYLKITSGSGEAMPSFLIITPLMHGSSVLGVIELASFNELQEYEINLVELTASAIAAEIASIKVKEHTNTLLVESRSLSAKMAEEEKVMRSELKQFEKKHKTSKKTLADLSNFKNTIDSTLFIFEYDTSGIIRQINDAFVEYTNIEKEELIGKPLKHALADEIISDEQNKIFWEELTKGQVKRRISKYKLNDDVYHLSESYAQVYDSKTKEKKIINIATDVTNIVEEQLYLKTTNAQLSENQQELEESVKTLTLYREQVHHTQNQLSNIIQVVDPIVCLAEFDFDGVVHSINAFFEATYSLLKTECIGNHVSDILHFSYKEYDNILETVTKGKTHRRESRVFTEKDNVWLSEYFTPVKDSKGELVKIWYVAFDISDTKRNYISTKGRLEKTIDIAKRKRAQFVKNLEYTKTLELENLEHAVFQNALDDIVTLARYSPDGKLLGYNDKLRRLIRKEPEEVRGISFEHVMRLQNNIDPELFWMDVQTESVEVETQLLLTEREVWFSEVYYPIFDGELPREILAVGIEITPMKQAVYENTSNKIKLEGSELKIAQILAAESEAKRKLSKQQFNSESYKHVLGQIASLAEFNSGGQLMFADEKTKAIFPKVNYTEAHLSDFVVFDTFDEFNAIWSKLSSGILFSNTYICEAGKTYKQYHIPILRDGALVKALLINI